MALVGPTLPHFTYARIKGELDSPTAWPFLSSFEAVRLLTARSLKGQYTDEAACDSQPSFFLPRFEWPSSDESELSNALNVSPNDAVGEIGRIPPMPPWQDPVWLQNQVLSRAPGWKQHLTDIRNVLVEIHEQRFLSQAGVNSLLTIMLYGLEGIISKISSPLRICMYKQGDVYVPAFYRSPPSEHRYVPGTTLVRGSHIGGLPYPNWTWFNMAGRRFLVGAIQFYDGQNNSGVHWSTIIFDRQTATLYYIDTLVPLREERFKAACFSVRSFWFHQGLPFSFTAICLNLAHHERPGSSGVLSIFTLWIMIRGLVGCDLRSMDELEALPVHPFPPIHRSYFNSTLGLLAPTWHLWNNPEISLSHARAILAAICCNELGIRNNKIRLVGGGDVPIHGASRFRYHLFGSPEAMYSITSGFSALGGYLPIEIWPIPQFPANWRRVFRPPAAGSENPTYRPFVWRDARATPSPDELPPPPHWFRRPRDGGHSELRAGRTYYTHESMFVMPPVPY
ncbi:unnamed protein product [Clonostachys solani]|uniref:Uncharacterized protein n=1 Tax=Clonostachys solani TaxID=160281 RepID=A0A9N9Z7S0_9HYPO|nr:unnamed protein product [Clonostachys solani]